MPTDSRVEYRFQSDLDINVWVIDPQGNRLAGADRVLQDSGSVKAATLGTYDLVFDNSFSLFTGKIVDLTYRVVPPGGR